MAVGRKPLGMRMARDRSSMAELKVGMRVTRKY
jgi:hypothetical protein